MQFPNLPALVKFTEFGVEHLAFPVGSSSPEHHLGENDEPLLDLVIVSPIIKDECARCGNSEARHDPDKMPPDHKFGICEKFIAPNPRTVGVDASQFVHIKLGVPHESHKFTAEQLDALQRQGNSVSIVYPGGAIPGGRWSEVAAEPDVLVRAQDALEKVTTALTREQNLSANQGQHIIDMEAQLAEANKKLAEATTPATAPEPVPTVQ